MSMSHIGMSNDISIKELTDRVTGEFTYFKDERFYVIYNVDKLIPFFISLVSSSDHWLFASSNGGITAGRVSPETALFPYIPVDKVEDSVSHTGSKTLLHVHSSNRASLWEPFNLEHTGIYNIKRNLYKSLLGDKLCFEEINNDLRLLFRYTWMSSDAYGFIRQSELVNLSNQVMNVGIVDGLQNILPAGVPRAIQTEASNLVDAYKRNELDKASKIGLFTLYSGMTDKPEPLEPMRVNTIFSLGLDNPTVLLSSRQLHNFREGKPLQQENDTRGIRGAYFINSILPLAPNESKGWKIIADIERSHIDLLKLRKLLLEESDIDHIVTSSIASGSDELQRIIGSMDGFQLTSEENVTVHHSANALFNGMRGGVFDDQHRIWTKDFIATIFHFNKPLYKEHQPFFKNLPKRIEFTELLTLIKGESDLRLERLCYEYLPLTFGRRHGDPSRPWNHFAIKIKDDYGKPVLSYQGNWRDIFQNWEALLLSYPEFIENVIAKFVNATTVDGYNPYRITKEGIDWEVVDPEDIWSYIGYWGDHQIIYLLKLLELSNSFHPDKLKKLLYHSIFSYANVPYRIKPFEDLLKNSKDTVEYDHLLADKIEQQVSTIGADGKLLLDDNLDVYLVNLTEKLIVPFLSKLSNLVPAGGIWLNTQRPEWNDANNALAGQGLSMVTLYYLRRYVTFMQHLLKDESQTVILSYEVNLWLVETADILKDISPLIEKGTLSTKEQFKILKKLGEAAERYRKSVYTQESFSKKTSQNMTSIRACLIDALKLIDYSISLNQRSDGLYHAYNIFSVEKDEIQIDNLYLMLEGQVALLSSGAIDTMQAINILEALFKTDLYRDNQRSFMLYPDKDLVGFLEKNRISSQDIPDITSLHSMIENGDETILIRDVDGFYRFNANITSHPDLDTNLSSLEDVYGKDVICKLRKPLHTLYENLFKHKKFTGRSGGMFGFEGLGCIYWHMVSKLLLAVQELFFKAIDEGAKDTVCNHLGKLYYHVREGIGFNKTPSEYGAFPTDPYSHTPRHTGAQQPGMTGQVKEEIITRFGELGIKVVDGKVIFQPRLLRVSEFIDKSDTFRYLDVSGNWQELIVPSKGVAFTWCQVPIIYLLDENSSPSLKIKYKDSDEQLTNRLELSAKMSSEIFNRTGKIEKITITLGRKFLYDEKVAN